jgi:hypothetical protein
MAPVTAWNADSVFPVLRTKTVLLARPRLAEPVPL